MMERQEQALWAEQRQYVGVAMDGTPKQGVRVPHWSLQVQSSWDCEASVWVGLSMGTFNSQKSAGLELRMELLSHFAGDECRREMLRDWLEVTQSANDWTPSTCLLLTPLSRLAFGSSAGAPR